MLFELDGVAPRLDEGAWVAPTAVVIGDVWLGKRSTIWFNCLVRGDTNRIRIGDRTNIQDGSVLHVNPGEEWVCEIGSDVTVGHMAIVHACKLHDFAFVGMGATVLDGAVIEEGAMLAAGALLTPGKRIPRRELWGGRPARKMRDLPDDERARMDHNAVHYAALGQRYRAGMRQVG
jgi:carbonic anhydrase/acetyltransferase-like protein (isoleucine patch superfamily)